MKGRIHDRAEFATQLEPVYKLASIPVYLFSLIDNIEGVHIRHREHRGFQSYPQITLIFTDEKIVYRSTHAAKLLMVYSLNFLVWPDVIRVITEKYRHVGTYKYQSYSSQNNLRPSA